MRRRRGEAVASRSAVFSDVRFVTSVLVHDLFALCFSMRPGSPERNDACYFAGKVRITGFRAIQVSQSYAKLRTNDRETISWVQKASHRSIAYVYIPADRRESAQNVRVGQSRVAVRSCLTRYAPSGSAVYSAFLIVLLFSTTKPTSSASRTTSSQLSVGVRCKLVNLQRLL